MKQIKLKIKITKEVLEKTMMCGIGHFKLEGSKYNITSHNCAITHACRKLFSNCYTSSAAIRQITIDGTVTIAFLPGKARIFIRKFDELKENPHKRLELEPFEFEITLTEEALDLISIDEITEVLKDSTTLELV